MRHLASIIAALLLLGCAVTARDVVAVDVRCERPCDGPLLDAIGALSAARGLRRDGDRLQVDVARSELAPLARLDSDVEQLRAIRGALDLSDGARGHLDLVFASYPSADGVALKLRWLTRLMAPPAARRGLAFASDRDTVQVRVDLDPLGLAALLGALSPWLPPP